MDALGDQRGDNSETLVPPPNLVEIYCDEFGAPEAFSDQPCRISDSLGSLVLSGEGRDQRVGV